MFFKSVSVGLDQEAQSLFKCHIAFRMIGLCINYKYHAPAVVSKQADGKMSL